MSEDDITSAPEAPASDAPIVVQGLENRFGDFVVHGFFGVPKVIE